MSTFDNPSDFLNQSFEGPTSTKGVLVPEGEYDAHVHDVSELYVFTYGPTTKRAGQEGAMVSVTYLLNDRNGKLEAITNRKENFVRGTLPIELMYDPNNSNLLVRPFMVDGREGRNLALGRMREATGTNEGRFKITDLKGKRIFVRVEEGVDSRDGSPQMNVVAFAAPGEKLPKARKKKE
jgi:hypothetical protein